MKRKLARTAGGPTMRDGRTPGVPGERLVATSNNGLLFLFRLFVTTSRRQYGAFDEKYARKTGDAIMYMDTGRYCTNGRRGVILMVQQPSLRNMAPSS